METTAATTTVTATRAATTTTATAVADRTSAAEKLRFKIQMGYCELPSVLSPQL